MYMECTDAKKTKLQINISLIDEPCCSTKMVVGDKANDCCSMKFIKWVSYFTRKTFFYSNTFVCLVMIVKSRPRVSHLTCLLRAFAVVLQESTAILCQFLDHLQSGQVLLVMHDALVPLLQRRGHREHVPEATIPRHCQLTNCWLSRRQNARNHTTIK